MITRFNLLPPNWHYELKQMADLMKKGRHKLADWIIGKNDFILSIIFLAERDYNKTGSIMKFLCSKGKLSFIAQ